ncbi:RidA family protein [Acinetobacter rudis]|uniref:RidA family protein n=1 Tax=Acinetobacter rudis TaxID=632955 RepID=A0AAW8J6A2_9GAMM|nr:RidA family protein [Acinetobacter rudis]MDQ8935607.1 RidA family protein [Acinetobacter rudis]MDQ8953368.1 RidA family protein [Acinetobacter rudis]MDQ9017870.1 RidA family protein [Acinetobacter rudis]
MQLPFSKSLESNGFIFLSGEIPFDKNGNIPEGIEAQTDLVLENIKATLAKHGAGIEDVVSVTVYLTDKADFQKFNQVYEKHLVSPYPVRSTVIADLVIDAKVEITVIAQKK